MKRTKHTSATYTPSDRSSNYRIVGRHEKQIQDLELQYGLSGRLPSLRQLQRLSRVGGVTGDAARWLLAAKLTDMDRFSEAAEIYRGLLVKSPRSLDANARLVIAYNLCARLLQDCDQLFPIGASVPMDTTERDAVRNFRAAVAVLNDDVSRLSHILGEMGPGTVRWCLDLLNLLRGALDRNRKKPVKRKRRTGD
jgi:hypothetical protein